MHQPSSSVDPVSLLHWRCQFFWINTFSTCQVIKVQFIIIIILFLFNDSELTPSINVDTKQLHTTANAGNTISLLTILIITHLLPLIFCTLQKKKKKKKSYPTRVCPGPCIFVHVCVIATVWLNSIRCVYVHFFFFFFFFFKDNRLV